MRTISNRIERKEKKKKTSVISCFRCENKATILNLLDVAHTNTFIEFYFTFSIHFNFRINFIIFYSIRLARFCIKHTYTHTHTHTQCFNPKTSSAKKHTEWRENVHNSVGRFTNQILKLNSGYEAIRNSVAGYWFDVSKQTNQMINAAK